MSILNTIIERKKESLPKPGSIPRDLPKAAPGVVEKLRRKNNGASLIAEIKRSSPSRGSLRPTLSISEGIDLYTPFASAISILTEENYFGGSLADLQQASTLTQIPLLRKDFITIPEQVLEARQAGASLYLLIVAALDYPQMNELLAVGREYGMPALIEVHNEKELEAALRHDIEILGVNNRNLHDLTIDLSTTRRLLDLLPPDLRTKLVTVAESGISRRSDLELLPPDIDALLIGTAFMESDDPVSRLRELTGR